jgi:hypothetical protein
MLMRYQAALRSDRGGSADMIDHSHPPRAMQPAAVAGSPCKQLVKQCPNFEELTSHVFQRRLQLFPRRTPTGRDLGRSSHLIEREKLRPWLRIQRRRCVAQPTFTEQLLNSADRVPLLIEVLSDPPQQIDILRPVVTAATATLERFQLGELCFPEPQHMRRQIELLRDFARGAKRCARFYGAARRRRSARLGHLKPMTPWPLPCPSPSSCLCSVAPDRG